MFQKDRFVEDCRRTVRDGQKAVREVVLEAVGDPSAIISQLGEPTKPGVFPLYKGTDATVINFVWAPCMTLLQLILETEGDDIFATGVMGLIFGDHNNRVDPTA